MCRTTNYALSVLNQLEESLESITIEVYPKKLAILGESSIGMHVRHILEFYACLLNGYQTGTVDYDSRERNERLQEVKSAAIDTLRELKRTIEKLEDKVLVLQVGYSDGLPKKENIPSTYRRELIYNIEHTIHHMAIIKIGMKSLSLDCLLPESFGVAPSTLQYLKQLNRHE
ncbi:MAG: hypothetical protein WD426_05245 [Anditalea sp.]